eukprot:XP_016656510.1 PREDICTED: uncharacterized protein LOC100569001 isoform X2 [Acyrthosiphon pisum]
MSFLNIFKKKQTQTSSSESSYVSNFSDEVSGDYVIKKSRKPVVQDTESLWDCRDRMLLNLRKIKTEVGEDEAKIQPDDTSIIVEKFQPNTTLVDMQDSQTIDQSTGTSTVTDNPTNDKSQQMSSRTSSKEFQPDTTTVDLRGSVSSQTIDQSTVEAEVTYKPMTDNSQQMSTESSIKCVPKNTKIPICNDTAQVTCKLTADKSLHISTESIIKHVEKKTKLPPVIEPQNIEWDESCMKMKEYSAYNSMVDKLCRVQTNTQYPKNVKNRVFAPSYCGSNSYHCCPCHEVMVPVHKIAYGVSMLVKHVFETRQLLERSLQKTDHTVQKSEIQLRLRAAAAEAKHLAGKLTFLVIDVNHTTGTPDQIEMLINVYDACFRRFKKIMKIVRRIEMPEQREKL